MLLLVCTLAAATAVGKPAQGDSSLDAFWQKFKAAVEEGNRQAVAALTRFPLGMSYGVPKIKSGAELRRRYRQVFSEQADAKKCFATARPEVEASKPGEFTVACPDAAGNMVVIYHFKRTKSGWKFVALDNLNE